MLQRLLEVIQLILLINLLKLQPGVLRVIVVQITLQVDQEMMFSGERLTVIL